VVVTASHVLEKVMQKADALKMTPEDRRQLESWARSKTIPARVVERSRILLLLAEGTGIRPAADQLRVGYNTVRQNVDPVGFRDQKPLEGDVQFDLHEDPVPLLAQGMSQTNLVGLFIESDPESALDAHGGLQDGTGQVAVRAVLGNALWHSGPPSP